MRGVVQLGVGGFAIALGVVVGNRLSSEAMAVVVGVMCGVLASIPVSVMVLVLTRRLNGASRSGASVPVAQGMAYPPVIVIQPDGRRHDSRFALPWDAPAGVEKQPWQRSFTVVGDEDEF